MRPPDPRKTLWTFEWLARRNRANFGSMAAARLSLMDLDRYIGACPPHDPLFNRLFRVLDLMETLLAPHKGRRGAVELLMDAYRQLWAKAFEGCRGHGPIVLTEAEQLRELKAALTGGQAGTFEAVRQALCVRAEEAEEPLKGEIEGYLKLMAAASGD
jgi:hypothetical protein